MTAESTINLEDFRPNGSKVFTGRDRGRQVRLDSHIDELADSSNYVKVVIPANIYSIIPSFFEELFINIISKYGRIGFFNKVKIVSEGNYEFEIPLNEAIDRVLRDRTAIG